MQAQAFTFGTTTHLALPMLPCTALAIAAREQHRYRDLAEFPAPSPDLATDTEASPTPTAAPPKPVPLTVNPDGIPTALKSERRWVVWNYEWREGKEGKAGAWTKPPYSAVTHRKVDVRNPSNWRSFDDALAAYEDGKCDGIGFALGDGWAGFDADDTNAPEIVRRLNSYTETSPSGDGVHVLVRGSKPGTHCKTGDHELYERSRYFTVTGHHLAGTPMTVEERTAEIAAVYAQLFPPAEQKPESNPSTVPAQRNALTDDEVLAKAKAAKNRDRFTRLWQGDLSGNDGDHSDADLALCCMLAFWTGRDAAQIDRLFRQSNLHRPKWDERRGATTYGERTIATAIERTENVYSSRSADGELSHVFDPNNPLPTAREFAAQTFTVGDVLGLRHQGGVFFAYDPDISTYREADDAALRSRVYAFLEPAQQWVESKKGRRLGPFKPNTQKVSNVMDALKAITNLPTWLAAPCWLGDPEPGVEAIDVLVCRNGLLHVPTRTLYAPTPRFFSTTAIEFDYDPWFPEPVNWLTFLRQLWPDDQQSIDTLQEWFGYQLTPDTRFQKIGMIVGPKRSGKGTIARVMRSLIGERNSCGPTLANMSEQFGLSILIGKTVAVIADARISGRSDTSVITERLLTISGQDPISIARKFLPDWTGQLPTRFTILTNELPRIEDASGALSSRFVVLALEESFYGREDPHLFDRLKLELPGILLWALRGRDRLYARGQFEQPETAKALIQELDDLGSPIGAFLRECCVIERGGRVRREDLFKAWEQWSTENGRQHSGTTQTFGRNLRAALPRVRENRPEENGKRVRYYEGLSLTPEWAARLIPQESQF